MYLKIVTSSEKESFDSFVRITDKFETRENTEVAGVPVVAKEGYVFFEGYANYQGEKVEVNGCLQSSELTGVVADFMILKSEIQYSLALNLFHKNSYKNSLLNINSCAEGIMGEEVKTLRSEIILRYLGGKYNEIVEEINEDYQTKIFNLTEQEEKDLRYNFETRLYALQDKFYFDVDSPRLRDFRDGYYQTKEEIIKEITKESE